MVTEEIKKNPMRTRPDDCNKSKEEQKMFYERKKNSVDIIFINL